MYPDNIKLLADIIKQRTTEYKQLKKEAEKKAKLIRGYKILLARLKKQYVAKPQ